MTDVKAQELSYDEWRELLEPYGWTDITVRARRLLDGGTSPHAEYEFRVMLKAGDAPDEWALRSNLLDQARRAVEAVQAKGYFLPDAPRIEFGGRYMRRLGIETPAWFAEAELWFSARLGR